MRRVVRTLLSYFSLCVVALTVSAESDLAGPSDSRSSEQRLIEAIRQIGEGELDGVLGALSELLRAEPNFRLAQLVYADVLSARAGALPRFGDGASSANLSGLLREAKARWRRYSLSADGGLPPGGSLVAGEVLSVPPSVDRILLVELDTYRLYVLSRNESGHFTPIDDYYVSIGKGGSDKQREGDDKTPVGVYSVVSHLPGDQLPPLYGHGAFPLDYPNSWDRLHQKTGSGIWIHGTQPDFFSRPPRSSRGCVTLSNTDLLALEEAIDVGVTPVIVAGKLDWVAPEVVQTRRDELLDAVAAWKSDWESRDPGRYLAHYSRSFRTDGMDYAEFARYKRRVNSSKSYIRIGIFDLSIYGYPGETGLVRARFAQTYESDSFNGRQIKEQYWKKEGDEWKIVLEAEGR